MLTVHKFPIQIADDQELNLPKDARVLTIQAQRDKPCLWALVDPEEAEAERWQLVTLGTGHPAPPDLAMFGYFATYQLREGELVFHVYLRRVQ